MKTIRIVLVVLFTTILLTSCKGTDLPDTVQKEMLIYCGITLVNPIKELASRFEKEHSCKITIIQGGSEDLYQSLKYSKVGEMYLPGSSFYRTTHLEEGFLGDYVLVGYNQASLIVQKGNPKDIPADIYQMANKKYATVIGNPDSCSIGKHSKKILSELEIFDTVMKQAILIAADSRAMNKTIIDKSSDLILNWGSTAFFDNNKAFMDRLPLDESIASKNNLLLNLLSFAREPELAKKFMVFAASTEGQTVFHSYGFLDEVSTPKAIQYQ